MAENTRARADRERTNKAEAKGEKHPLESAARKPGGAVGKMLDGPAINVGNAERALSFAGGAVLALFALRRMRLFVPALMALGAALMVRGATGRCEMVRALGRDTAAPA